MATTPNYAWTTPDDTNLVKNGASDIRTLANAIDSTVKTNDTAALKATLVDAKGDLLAGTAADTIARLAVGTDGQVLTADAASATGMKWNTPVLGGMTQISSTTLSGNSVTLSSIPSTYKNIYLVLRGVQSSTTNYSAWLQINGDTSSSYISGALVKLSNNPTTTYSQGSALTTFANISNGIGNPNNGWSATLEIEDYTSSAVKCISGRVIGQNTGSAWASLLWSAIWSATSSVNSLTIGHNTGNFTGGTVILYGVN